jgi:primosomal protein N' (replication factor Y) (superfamily II helicase)
MFYLVKVLIGRSIASLDRSFSYYTLDENIQEGMRVLVPFGSSKETMGFVVEKPEKIEMDVEEYQKEKEIKLAKILKSVDDEPLLDESLLKLAKKIAEDYQSDLIRVLNCMLPPSLKPKNSALNKPQGKFLTFVFANEDIDDTSLSKNEKTLYEKILAMKNGCRLSKVTAKASLESLLKKNALRKEEIPVSRIPEMEAGEIIPVTLTMEQEEVYQKVHQGKDKEIFLLQGVTGSGKTEVYLHLAETYLKEGKGVLVLIPEIALTDRMSYLFASHFKDSLSILNSSLSDSRKYDEYKRILSGESKIVLGTRSAIFAPVNDLSLIIIDEEHSSSYKQDNVPYYDAIKVACMRAEIQGCKVLLASATPRVIDKARAMKNVYTPLYMRHRHAQNQDKEIIMVDMNKSEYLNPSVSSMISIPLQKEIEKNLQRKEQVMVLINRRGYAPIYVCRNCHKTIKCPNCDIPLNYHKRDDSLKCHHCGYQISAYNYTCDCKGHDFITLGYGTERAYEELRMLFPLAKITRLDGDISSNEVRHEVLQSFADGDTDIIVGTQIIAKGHDFPRVTLACMLNADASLNLPTFMANEETFDLISQFVGRAGRGNLKGRVVIQTYVPDNKVIQLATKQDYDSFYALEMEERKKYMYPPYTYLASITIKAFDQKYCDNVAIKVKEYLLSAIGNKKFNVYGPSAPYIPHINGRYYRNILVKYKSIDEAKEIFRGIKTLRIANKEAEILINIDPGSESI